MTIYHKHYKSWKNFLSSKKKLNESLDEVDISSVRDRLASLRQQTAADRDKLNKDREQKKDKEKELKKKEQDEELEYYKDHPFDAELYKKYIVDSSQKLVNHPKLMPYQREYIGKIYDSLSGNEQLSSTMNAPIGFRSRSLSGDKEWGQKLDAIEANDDEIRNLESEMQEIGIELQKAYNEDPDSNKTKRFQEAMKELEKQIQQKRKENIPVARDAARDWMSDRRQKMDNLYAQTDVGVKKKEMWKDINKNHMSRDEFIDKWVARYRESRTNVTMAENIKNMLDNKKKYMIGTLSFKKIYTDSKSEKIQPFIVSDKQEYPIFIIGDNPFENQTLKSLFKDGEAIEVSGIIRNKTLRIQPSDIRKIETK